MTDKQIIIDGVDVSGCNRLNTFPMQYGEPHEICLTSLEQWGGQEKYCKDRPNCYYKQLKRKEQECERLKEIANNALDKVNNYLDNKEKSLLYKQTLLEIKEIIHFNKTNRLSGGACISIEQILQKISEVEE